RGQLSSGDVQTGSGVLSLVNNLTVNAFQGSSDLTPASTISGFLNVPALFSGIGGSAANHTWTINDAALPGVNEDLIISAAISGAGATSILRQGAGTLTFSGDNLALASPVILNAGITNIGSNTALGTGLVSLRGGDIQAVGGARTLGNAIYLDGNTN